MTDSGGSGGKAVLRDEAAARLARKAAAERARRRSLAEARAALLALPDSPALCSLVRAAKFMTRRGYRLLRRWSLSDDPKTSLAALRLLTDSVRVLVALRQSELALGLREASEPEAPSVRVVQAVFAADGEKS